MKYGLYWKGVLKELFIMLNNKMFKIYKSETISLCTVRRLKSKGFKEIIVEPTSNDVIMFSSQNEISFEKCIKLLGSFFNINILAALSIIYYNYSKEYLDYIGNNSHANLMLIRFRTYKIMLRWKKMLERSDDTLYPQNKYIRDIIRELKI